MRMSIKTKLKTKQSKLFPEKKSATLQGYFGVDSRSVTMPIKHIGPGGY